jgi:hypothetical protein
MGFSVRKRTKGKDGWVNGSLSSRGAHASVSTKLGKDVTLNTSGRGTRLTINLGNGLRYTKSSSRRKQKQQTQDQEVHQPMTDEQWSEYKSYIRKRVYFWGGLFLLFVLYSWLTH